MAVVSAAPDEMTTVEPSARSIDRRLLGELAPARRAVATSVCVGLITTATVIAQALLLAQLLGWAMSSHPGPFPSAVVVGLLAAIVARALVGGFGEALAGRAGASVSAALRRSILAASVAGGPVWLARQRTGSVALVATRGLRALEPYFSRYLPAAVVAAVAPPAALIVLAIVDWPSALLALALVVLVPIAMIRLGRRAAAESERQWRRLSSLSGRVLELLRGIPTLKALGGVERGRQELEAASTSVANGVDATLRAAMASTAALEFLAGVGVGLVAMLAGLRLLNGSMSIVPALAVLLLTPEVFLPLRRAGAEFHASTEGRAAAASAYDIIDAAPPLPSKDDRIVLVATPIAAEAVSVRYPGADQDALEPTSFELAPGSQLVVTGASGTGKSTLLALLCGFIEPSGGRLLLAGQALRQHSLQRGTPAISLLPQQPHVFARSLRDNVSLGLDVDDARLRHALELVGLEHLIVDGGEGLDQVLAEAGRTMSAGERQRLGIARIIVQDRELVLLDEPTSHLDQASEAELASRLRPWLAERSVIEVGHRAGLLGPQAKLLRLSRHERER